MRNDVENYEDSKVYVSICHEVNQRRKKKKKTLSIYKVLHYSISDAVFYFTQAVADSLKLPRIVLRTSGVSSFVVFAAFPLLRERGYLPIQGTYVLPSHL
jgi:hypothetical protein